MSGVKYLASMNIVSISDLHIVKTGDIGEVSLQSFFSHPLVTSSDIIVLNGDVFDFAAGFHPEYYHRYSDFFVSIKRLMSSGIKIVFIEGNHDAHIKENFLRFIKDHNLNQTYFEYCPYFFKTRAKDRDLYFTHGDETPGASETYLKYKQAIRSPLASKVANLLPLFLFDYLASRASKNSRSKSSRYSEMETKEFFRNSGISAARKVSADICVLGHSHIADHYQKDSIEYFNTGYAPKSRKFFSYRDGNARLESF